MPLPTLMDSSSWAERVERLPKPTNFSMVCLILTGDTCFSASEMRASDVLLGMPCWATQTGCTVIDTSIARATAKINRRVCSEDDCGIERKFLGVPLDLWLAEKLNITG